VVLQIRRRTGSIMTAGAREDGRVTERPIPPQHPPWGTNVPLTWVTDGDPEYAALLTEVRGFLDALASARPEPSESAELAEQLRHWRDRLQRSEIGEHGQVFGRRPDLPSRGNPMLPDYVVDHVDGETIGAHVRFGRYYLGGGEAVHGGAIPLVLDELLGTLTNFGARPPSRTAYLTVHFRALTPLDTDLRLTGQIDRVEGRKTFVTGRVMHGDVLCADAEALFVALPPESMRPRGG